MVGGSEYGSDIFVASVKAESMPDKAGLTVGDQVRVVGGEGRDEEQYSVYNDQFVYVKYM